MVGQAEVHASARRRLFRSARVPCARLGRGGSTAALVREASRYGERGSDGCDQAAATRRLGRRASAHAASVGIGGSVARGSSPALRPWHTTALEKAFAREFFGELKAAAHAHGLGHTTTYEKAVLEQGKYEAGRLRNYISKLGPFCRRPKVPLLSFCVTRASASSTSHHGSVDFLA